MSLVGSVPSTTGREVGALRQPMTFPAHPMAAFGPVGIEFVEEMPSETVSLPEVSTPDSVTSPVVLARSDRLHVGGIGTPPIPTQMVEVEVRGNRTYQQFVDGSVSVNRGSAPTASLDLPIPLVERRLPGPALIWSTSVDLGPQALLDWASFWRHDMSIALCKSAYNRSSL